MLMGLDRVAMAGGAAAKQQYLHWGGSYLGFNYVYDANYDTVSVLFRVISGAESLSTAIWSGSTSGSTYLEIASTSLSNLRVRNGSTRNNLTYEGLDVTDWCKLVLDKSIATLNKTHGFTITYGTLTPEEGVPSLLLKFSGETKAEVAKVVVTHNGETVRSLIPYEDDTSIGMIDEVDSTKYTKAKDASKFWIAEDVIPYTI